MPEGPEDIQLFLILSLTKKKKCSKKVIFFNFLRLLFTLQIYIYIFIYIEANSS